MKKICVITGTRAEYGLLYWLMKEIEDDSELLLQLVVTGMHLSPEFGLTYRQIEEDGFVIADRVEMLLSSDTSVGVSKSVGLGIIGFTDAFTRLRPDLVVVLGDRYEILAAATAAMLARIPLAHLHGGEKTEGAVDESIRHSISKMANLHFTANDNYRKRVIQLGEQPERVFNVGAMCWDNLMRCSFLSRDELQAELGVKWQKNNFLITYHPETLLKSDVKEQMTKLFAALDRFTETQVIFTKANADAAGREINALLEEYARKRENVSVFSSLGSLRYLSLVKAVDVVIGNSSSGLLEVPFLQRPTVNIGERQKGRLRPASVIDCTVDNVYQAVRQALSPEHHAVVQQMRPLSSTDSPALKVIAVIKEWLNKSSEILVKKFYDLEVQ